MAKIQAENLGIRMDKDLKSEYHVLITLEFQERDHQKEVTVAMNEEEARAFSKVFDEHIRMVKEKNVAKVN